MVEDANGLRVKGMLALATSAAREAQALLKMGAINGLSIGFLVERMEVRREDEHPHAHRG